MAMIKKTVSGVSEDLKQIKSGKQYSKVPQGGTSRPKFAGSIDTRTAGAINSNETMMESRGYIDQGPVYMGETGLARKWVKTGARAGVNSQVTVSKENVTGGMGGKFVKDNG